MLQSMTAFARQASQADFGQLVFEIRSVNHRYLEMSFRLPEELRDIEMSCRQIVKKYLQRGKVDINLRFNPGKEIEQSVSLNMGLVKALITAGRDINAAMGGEGQLRPADILRWPGLVEISPKDLTAVHGQALQLFEASLQQLVEVRQGEGQAIAEMLQQRLAAISEIVTPLKEKIHAINERYHEKILERAKECQVKLNEERLEQEMVIMLQKTDVAEELDRLIAHVSEVTRVLASGGVVGRRLDFLMQELNREANTLSSKSIDAFVSQSAVDLKVLIEQMREQIQNLQ